MARISIPSRGILVICLCWAAMAAEAAYTKYQDPNQTIKVRIEDLLSRMTLAEKIGQMTQIERTVASGDVIEQYFIGSVLSGAGSVPAENATARTWIDMVNGLQKGAMSTRLGIPIIYGIDAVHGNSNVFNATIFPHNIGLGATRQVYTSNKTFSLHEIHVYIHIDIDPVHDSIDECSNGFLCNRDPDLVKKIGAATALEVRATGIQYTFAPCIAVCRDPRWGRCYESYSEDHTVVQAMTEIISGLQGEIPSNSRKGVPFVGNGTKVVACAKHFVGDGGTIDGIDENNTVISRQELMSIHMPAYLNSIAKGVSTVMISYSSWNGIKMHANQELITGYLKNQLRFRGIDKITTPMHANYTYSVLMGIQAGIDMVMVPFNYTEFIDTLTSLVNQSFIPMSRIDDAVRRILRVKFTAGLFERPYADYSFINELGRQEHRELAREAVRKTLVLLKNGKPNENPLLPLPKKAAKILIAGTHADDLGTTILDGIKKTVDPTTEVVYKENPDPNYAKSVEFSYAIVVVGEPPYAEMFGDSSNLTIPEPGPSIIANVCGYVRCVVVLVTGRPVVIQPYVSMMDALVAAWLPGTEGQGVADVLFGDYGFTGKLSRTWFRTVDQLPMTVGDQNYDPLFPFGFGLTTQPTQ
ncbi:hypothetical protein RHSIM_Rhsim03G0055000 [Rhododendron simsii]|uniref:Uncharacterized protein n=1 Tax=Rhododendron simsii TaxID=118357 RepID=A0A834H4L0_RHOSS|nr:hypothetical protein RHSIM_Rhsim03G0055000 [Rhododendron simsii]